MLTRNVVIGVLQLSLVIKHATGVEKVFKKVSSMTAVEAARKLRQRQEMCTYIFFPPFSLLLWRVYLLTDTPGTR